MYGKSVIRQYEMDKRIPPTKSDDGGGIRLQDRCNPRPPRPVVRY